MGINLSSHCFLLSSYTLFLFCLPVFFRINQVSTTNYPSFSSLFPSISLVDIYSFTVLLMNILAITACIFDLSKSALNNFTTSWTMQRQQDTNSIYIPTTYMLLLQFQTTYIYFKPHKTLNYHCCFIHQHSFAFTLSLVSTFSYILKLPCRINFPSAQRRIFIITPLQCTSGVH